MPPPVTTAAGEQAAQTLGKKTALQAGPKAAQETGKGLSQELNQEPSSPPSEEEEESGTGTSSFTSPEAILMFTIAGILDLVGLIVFILDFVLGIGLLLSIPLDIIGLISIGLWMYIRSGQVPQTKSGQKLKKIGVKIGKRLGLAFLSEAVPFWGDIAPSWTLTVFFELKNNPI